MSTGGSQAARSQAGSSHAANPPASHVSRHSQMSNHSRTSHHSTHHSRHNDEAQAGYDNVRSSYDEPAPIEEYPPLPPESVASFAASNVGPGDSVSQVGSRVSRSSRSILESVHRRRSRSTNSQSLAGSKLTAANLRAHNTEPQLPVEVFQQAEQASQSPSERMRRDAHQAPHENTAGSQASTIKASQRSPDTRSQANGGSQASRSSNAAKRSNFETSSGSQAGVKYESAASIHVSQRGPPTASLHSNSPRSMHHGSKVGSRTGPAVTALMRSNIGIGNNSRAVSNGEDHAANYSWEEEARMSSSSRQSSQHLREPLSHVQSLSPQNAAASRARSEASRAFGGSSHSRTPSQASQSRSVRQIPSREPSPRPVSTELDIEKSMSNIYVVEVERSDEQVSGSEYRILRRHEYHVHD